MKVLVILTGGTISMVRDAQTGALHPADLQTFKDYVPEMFAGPYWILQTLIPTTGAKWHTWWSNTMMNTMDL